MNQKKFTIKKLSTRFMIMFLGITIGLFTIFFLIISSLFSDKLTQEINLVASQQLKFASSLLDSKIEEIRSYHFSLVKNSQIQALLPQLSENLDTQKTHALQDRLKQAIDHTEKSSLNIRSAFAINKNFSILDPLYSSKDYQWLVNANPEFQKFLRSQLTLRISSPNAFPFPNTEDDSLHFNSTITCFGRIYDQTTYQDIGYLAVNINRKSLFKDIENLFQETFTQFYVIDENENIIFSNPVNPVLSKELHSILSTEYPTYGKKVSIDNVSCMGYSSTVNHYPNWKIIGFIDCNDIYKPVRHIFLTMLVVLFVLILCGAVVHYYLTQSITVPISALREAMRSIRKGHWPVSLSVARNDEVSEMLESFNKMNLSLQKMTKQITRQQEEARKNEVALLQSQLDLLESQINPHFIHNTLNTMKYLARLARAEKLENLITSFNALLRTSMSTNRLMISLEEEVENLYHYMDIQKERYDIPIDFQCDITEDAKNIPLPKLILQPLVENSLFHGIAPNDGGSIYVKARVAEKRLWVIVWDNGAGIPESKLTLLEERLLPSKRGYSRIGIANVNDRLILSYGASSHLVIESTPCAGTSFSFSIPV